jgi:general secretion pathway protein D
MRIIEELDTAGFPEAIEVIPLMYTKSDYLSKIITQLIPGAQEPQFRYGPFPPKQLRIGGYYLSEQTKIVPIERTNSIAILGPPDSVQRIKDFIEKHLDLPIESEKSVIHVKSLQYLNADELAPVIQDLVKSRATGAQAEAASSEKDTLANAIIVAEKQVQATNIQPTAPGQQQTATPNAPSSAPIIGGNRLIVAARTKDWQLINRLVDQLDQPQLQVAIEVLVADLAITDDHLIGSQIRNSLDGTRPQGANFQSVQLSPTTWLNFIDNDRAKGVTPQGIASDLLRYPNPNTPPVNIATLATAGSTLLSFKNGNGISYILKLLQNYSSATILSQPFVITKNNLQANITIAREIYLEMGVDTQSTGGPVIRQRKPMKADLTVNILPRISKSSEINLEILVNVNDFQPGTGNNVITTRQVRTNSNLKNKEVLVIGGLARVDTRDVTHETPLLGKIPILGFLFKNKQQEIIKRNLMIFISPSIIRPRLQGGMDIFTKNKVDFIKGEIDSGEIELLGSNFDQLRDPITRVYFTPLGKQVKAAIDYYAEQKAYEEGTEKIEVAKEISLVGGSPESVGVKLDSEIVNAEKLKTMVKDDDNPLMAKIEN